MVLRRLTIKQLYGLSYEQTEYQAKQVLETLAAELSDDPAQGLMETLETFIPRAERVIDQTIRRVFQDEQVPADEKIVSIFEPQPAVIRRGKAGKPVEYGRKVWLDEVEGGIVTRWKVLDNNSSDKLQWDPSLDTPQQLFGKPPAQASAERGVFSTDNENVAKSRGIKRVVLPKPGKKSEKRRQLRNYPGSKKLIGGMPGSKAASMFSNDVITLTAVSIKVKMASIVGSLGA